MHFSSAIFVTLLIGAGIATPLPNDDSDLGFYSDDVRSASLLSKRQHGDFRGGNQGSQSTTPQSEAPQAQSSPQAQGPPQQQGSPQAQGLPQQQSWPQIQSQQQPHAPQSQEQPQAPGPSSQAQPQAESQGNAGSRYVNPVTSAAAAATAAPRAGAAGGEFVTTVATTLLTGTVTLTLVPNASPTAQAGGTGSEGYKRWLHRRQHQQAGIPWWQQEAFHGHPRANGGFSSPGRQWSHGGSMQGVQQQHQGSGSGSGSGSGQSSPPQGQAPPQSPSPPPQANQPQSSQAPAAAPAPGSSNDAPSSGSSSGGGASSGQDNYMSVVSKWRSAMGKPALTQDSNLEANAKKTATDDNGNMKHELNPGSMAQVLAPGNDGNFESVFVGGWLCEKPSLQGLNGICGSMSQGWDHSDGETGHADILSGNYKKIGCALVTGIWACDLA